MGPLRVKKPPLFQKKQSRPPPPPPRFAIGDLAVFDNGFKQEFFIVLESKASKYGTNPGRNFIRVWSLKFEKEETMVEYFLTSAEEYREKHEEK